jgi:hypothetical protein
VKSGLIIQGPILSPGVGPLTRISGSKMTRPTIDFDSTKNVLNLVESSVKIFDEVLLITWWQNLGSFDVFGNHSRTFRLFCLMRKNCLLKETTQINIDKYLRHLLVPI